MECAILFKAGMPICHQRGAQIGRRQFLLPGYFQPSRKITTPQQQHVCYVRTVMYLNQVNTHCVVLLVLYCLLTLLDSVQNHTGYKNLDIHV